MVLPMCCVPHKVLRQPTERIEHFTQELQRLAGDMIETMYAHDGIGLAAPQVGRSIQLFIANPTQQRGRELVVANPSVLSTTGRASVIEGCLSVPEVWHRVRRAASVALHGQNLQGRDMSLQAEGLLAIIVQHEVDHLQGRLFIDRLSWFARRRLRIPTH